MSNTLNNKLGIVPVIVDNNLTIIPEDEVSSDFSYVRENLYNATELGNDALKDLSELAKSSQLPRAYEVLATLLGRVVEANEKFLNLRKQRKELEEPNQNPTTINNNLTLTTAALNSLIENATKKD